MQDKPYRTVSKIGESFFEDRKSKFFGEAYHVETVAEAEERLSEIDKKYRDARHHCYAYVIGKDESAVKYSDNGEPQGTAGMPILEYIRAQGLTDVLVVVTRYFGGILLGTGGLSRAYREAGKTAVEAAGIMEYEEASEILLETDYSTIGKVEFLFRSENLPAMEISYGAEIKATLHIPVSDTERIMKKIKDISQGKAKMELTRTVFLEKGGNT